MTGTQPPARPPPTPARPVRSPARSGAAWPACPATLSHEQWRWPSLGTSLDRARGVERQPDQDVKRQMYGRARFGLLARVLLA